LQSDANARARLLGLRSALRFISDVLNRYQEQGKAEFQPLFIQGIELYLSEPVNCDDEFIKALFVLWDQLQLIDGLRKVLIEHAGNTALLKKNSSNVKVAAQSALPLAITLCQKVDAAIEKMKPLGDS
jgi:hypothetical protein